jgi:hypothetical protein
MRRHVIRLLGIAALYAGFCVLTSCGTPTYYSTSGGYYGTGGWYDPYYDRPCCRDYHGHYRPHHPHRPPGMRPPGARPPYGGHRPSIPSRPRPTPRPSRRR